MKCYYHTDVDAVAICAACQRGVCSDCAVDVEFTTSCRDRCEERVTNYVALFTQGRQAYNANATSYKGIGVFSFLSGVVMAFLGGFTRSETGGAAYNVTYLTSGLMLIVISFFIYRMGVKLGDKSQQPSKI